VMMVRDTTRLSSDSGRVLHSFGGVFKLNAYIRFSNERSPLLRLSPPVNTQFSTFSPLDPRGLILKLLRGISAVRRLLNPS
jgi:hypothetical protein